MLQTYTRRKILLGFRAELFRQIQRLFPVLSRAARAPWTLSIACKPDAASIPGDHRRLPGSFHQIQLDARRNVLRHRANRLAAGSGRPLHFANPLYGLQDLSSGTAPRLARSKDLRPAPPSPLCRGAWRYPRCASLRREDAEQERFVRHSAQGMRARLHLAWVEGRFSLVIGLTSAIGTCGGAIRRRSARFNWARSLLANSCWSWATWPQLVRTYENARKKSATLQGHLASVERAILSSRPDAGPRRKGRTLAPSIAQTGGFVCQKRIV